MENPLKKSSEITSVVISLRRQGDKLARFYERFEAAGFDRRTIAWLEGYDAEKEKDRPPMTLRQIDDFGQDRYDHRFFNRPGGYGCYMSHIQAWKWCVESGRPLFVYEDDANFPYGKKTKEFFETRLSKHFAGRENLLFLIGYHEIPGRKALGDIPRELPANEPILSVKGIFHGTHLYYVTPVAAKILLSNAFPIEMQVDSYMGLVGKHKGLVIEAFGKPLLNQVNFYETTIQSKCVLCNGKVNGSRFSVDSAREKKEFCDETGLCELKVNRILAKKNSVKSLMLVLGVCGWIAFQSWR